MEYTTISHDVETINNRIRRGQIKMDSDFQRGEVWTLPKKQKLIDTILRGWPIPPIQIVKLKDTEEILDGLQRVTAIIEFLKGEYSIDGTIQPKNPDLEILDGLTFLDIEEKAALEKDLFYRKILNIILSTSISAYYIQNPTSEEIAELFYRFNSPMQLNPVEKRNAFMGETRTQIKQLNEFFIESGARKETLGFNDIRGLYEDILVKVCYYFEFRDKRVTKLTTDKLVELYRENYKFSDRTITTIQSSIKLFFETIEEYFQNAQIKLSRTTVFSILLFICNNLYSLDKFKIQKVIHFSSGRIEKNTEIYNIYRNLTISGTTDAININLREYILYLICFNSIENIEIATVDELFEGMNDYYMEKIGVRIL